MDVWIIFETVFENGEVRTHDASHIYRPLEDAGPEDLGLRLVEAKRFLKQLQEAVLHNQIDEVLSVNRNCGSCGKQRAINNDCGRGLDAVSPVSCKGTASSPMPLRSYFG